MPKLFRPAHQALAGVSLPIIAAHHGDGIARKTVLALHHCKACDSQVVMNKLRVPACVVCAAVTNLADEAPDNDLVFTPENMRELPKVGHCDQCDTTLRAEGQLAKALIGKKGHCPTCATVVTFADFGNDEQEFEDDGEDEDPEADDEYADAFGDDPEDVPADDSSSDGGVYGDGDEVSDVPEDGDTNLFGGEDANADEEELDEEGNPIVASVRKNAKKRNNRQPVKAGLKKKTRRAQAELDDQEVTEREEVTEEIEEDERKPAPDADPNNPNPAPQDNSKDGQQPQQPKPENAAPVDNAPPRQIGASVLAQFMRKPHDAHIDIVLAGTDENPKYYLFIDEKPAAVAHVTRAKQAVKAFFGTDKFAQAFVAAVEDGITQDAITDFGFEPVNTQIPVDEATEMKVEQAIEDATKELNKKVAEAASLFERCVGIASVGVVKNVINDVDNPVRTALVAQLTKLRVRNAANVVDSVLAEHGEGYLREIVAKAKELTRKPSQALDELASVVAQASFSFPVEAGVEDAEEKVVVPFMATASHEQETVATPSGGRDDDTMDLLRGIRFAHVR